MATIFAPGAMEARQALRHQVVRRLLLEIFRGTLPAGTRLITQKLSEQLGISATPLREALVELEAIGIVDISHNRGAVVATPSPEETRRVFEARRGIEGTILRLAIARATQDDLTQLPQQLEQEQQE